MRFPNRTAARRACRNEYFRQGGAPTGLSAYLDSMEFVEDAEGWYWRTERVAAQVSKAKPKAPRKPRKRSD